MRSNRVVGSSFVGQVESLERRRLLAGAVLTGGSAGGLCWFEGGTTDSYGPTLQLLHEGLGMIKGSYCPHYDAEDQRRPIFHAALLDGSLSMGYASGNRVAIRFTPEGEVVEATSALRLLPSLAWLDET